MINPITKVEALNSLRPGAEWVLRGDVLTWIDSKQSEPTPSDIEAEIVRLRELAPWNELREKRDELLAKTDYAALKDTELSDAMKKYRQALRDLPANTSDPANPPWPEL
jgi:hypothetical protein|tara:strand:- start:140 stop:466 length:327 start_codon:yes stop_codon:yes gene_type:complete